MTAATTPDTKRVLHDLLAVTATTADLRTQIKQAHWNLVGVNFDGLHRALDEHAETWLLFTDTFAERMRALGGVAAGTARQVAEASQLPDLEARELPWQDAVSELVQRYESYSELLQECAKHIEDDGDLATQDLYLDAIRQADKYAWMLRVQLVDGGSGTANSRRAR